MRHTTVAALAVISVKFKIYWLILFVHAMFGFANRLIMAFVFLADHFGVSASTISA